MMTIRIPEFELPESVLLSTETKKALNNYRNYLLKLMDNAMSDGEPKEGNRSNQHQREKFYQGQPYKNLVDLYTVEIETGLSGDVFTESFIPAEGIALTNQDRILINLHGGNFDSGSQTNSRMESIPVAALGKIKVISVDYRMAPEYQFPAATDDVVAVYKTLLKNYKPENIGIYGTSSGAHLTAQTMVRLQENNIALPGAIGLIAEGATRMAGDSVSMIGALLKATYDMDLVQALESIEYLQGADVNEPQVTPAQSNEFMSRFPPSLLISSTRDFMLSSVVATHTQLIKLGIEADLHVWEGLDHVFHYNPDLPETTELHQVTVNFFEKYLGRGV